MALAFRFVISPAISSFEIDCLFPILAYSFRGGAAGTRASGEGGTQPSAGEDLRLAKKVNFKTITGS